MRNLDKYIFSEEDRDKIEFDQYGRPYVQSYTEYDSEGNILSVGGKFMLSMRTGYEFTIEN